MSGPLTFDAVTQASTARARRWHGTFPSGFIGDGTDWTGADWSNAMAGECGEACNVVKKIRRHETGVRGALDAPPAELVEALADELADTFLYLDLLATFYRIDLPTAIVRKFNAVSEREGFPERLRSS